MPKSAIFQESSDLATPRMTVDRTLLVQGQNWFTVCRFKIPVDHMTLMEKHNSTLNIQQDWPYLPNRQGRFALEITVFDKFRKSVRSEFHIKEIYWERRRSTM
jgi:hypothetical protein